MQHMLAVHALEISLEISNRLCWLAVRVTTSILTANVYTSHIHIIFSN